ncbi:MAG TPA: hypothetical protein DCS48_01635 [Desulfovibrio sp.]|nr:hypothetical protein [Desulfovibrio sp.]
MTPKFKIIADSKDVTAKIADRLIRLSVTDEAGQESDAVEIELDDRDELLEIPPEGAELEIYMGHQETGLHRMGLFTVGDVVVSGPPDTLTIPGHAANMRKSLKAKKDKSWDQVSISDIVATIAADHGLTPAISDELGKIAIPHIDQTAESDLHFLTRIADDFDAVAKPIENRLLFIPRGLAKSASGKQLPAIPIRITDNDRYRMVGTGRNKYKSVKAFWHSLDEGERMQVTVGSGKPCHCIPGSYSTPALARAAAQAKFNQLERGTGELSLSVGGNGQVAAERLLSVFGKKKITGEWAVKRVEHSLDDQGYFSHIECETPTGQNKGLV